MIGKVMPVEKKLTALEEAEFEDDGGEEGALEREMLMQCAFFYRDARGTFWVTHYVVCSHGEVARLQAKGDFTRPCGHGTGVCGRCSTASSRGLSCAKLRVGHADERFDTGRCLPSRFHHPSSSLPLFIPMFLGRVSKQPSCSCSSRRSDTSRR